MNAFGKGDMGLVQMVLGGPFCSLCFSLMHFISPLAHVIRCGQEGEKDGRPSLLLGEYTDPLGGFSWRRQVGQVSLEMCLSASCVHGKRSSVTVCMHDLSVTRACSAGTGRRALPDWPAPLAHSALLLSPTSQDPDPPSRPLSVLLFLATSLAALDLGLSALRRADSSLDVCPHADHLNRQ